MNEYNVEERMKKLEETFNNVLDRPWETAQSPLRMSEHCWYLGNTWVGVLLIDSGEGLILIDAGMPSQTYLIFEGIRSLGLNPKNIKKVLLTHGHFDHCGGMTAILAYTRAEFWGPKEDLNAIRGISLNTRGRYYAPCEPDRFYQEDVPVILGNICIFTMHTPGHTPGTTSFFFDDTLSSGQKVRVGIFGGLGANTLVMSDSLQDRAVVLQNRKDYRQSLERMEKEHVDVTMSIHPGMIRAFDRRSKDSKSYRQYIDPTVWPSTLKRYRERLDAIEAGEHTENADGCR
jgi:metallo-beta-lactamase class B